MANISMKELRRTAYKDRERLDPKTLTAEDKRNYYNRGSLCWSCNNAMTLGCPWFQGFRPVKDWIIIEGQMSDTKASSAFVLDCPLFTPLERYKNESKTTKEKDLVNLRDLQQEKQKEWIVFKYSPKNARKAQMTDERKKKKKNK